MSTLEKIRRIVAVEVRKQVNESVRRSSYSLRQIFEDADPGKIDSKLFPTRLSQVDAALAKDLASKGQQDKESEDDIVSAGTSSSPAASLHASQTTMDFGKFVGMAVQMMGKIGSFSGGAGGDLGAIISSDGYIMDGHHRWAATLMVDPSASVGGLRVDIPGEKLVGVLNVWTSAHGGVGKPSDTSLDSLDGESVAQKFKEMAGKGGKFLPPPTEILKALQANGFDSLEAAADHVKKNWDSTASSRSIEGWMPPKVDMPAIEPNQLAQVAKDITGGVMDINPPYSPDVAAATGSASKKPQNAGYTPRGSIVAERWQKLAGIIKG
jgi:hypothetical protein